LLPQHGSSAFLTYFAFVFLMTFVLSYISYKFYEYPIMKLGKKIANQQPTLKEVQKEIKVQA
ncbi:hypothetical protein, partial [Paenibacillus glucanolyticus]